MSILENLNKSQQEAGKVVEGPLLILAGAGSGKTRTLTYRIAHMIREKNISPYHVLAVTFTNKAAAEMKERVASLVGEDANKIVVSTFHSFGVRMLRMYASYLSYDNNFNIYDNDDQVRLVKKLEKEIGIKSNLTPKAIVSLISKLKEEGISPEEYEKTVPNFLENYKVLISIYRKYQEELKRNNSMDFSDLLVKSNELLDIPEVLTKVQDRYRYIMVDEYQDTNNIQYQIVKKIANKYKNICVVGDEDQSIYGFRGANIQNILDFEKDYKNAKVVKLEQNYRSTNLILKAANEVIKSNKSSRGKKLWTEIQGGEKIKLYAASNPVDEAYYVVQNIIEASKKGRKYQEFTILYRTNAQSRAFEEAFIRFNIPYKVFGGMQFYQRKEIKDIIAYLNVINNPKDNLSLLRIINVPNRKIGGKSIEKLIAYANEKEIYLLETFKYADNIEKLTKGAKEAIGNLSELFTKLIDLSQTESVLEILDILLTETKYIESFGEDEESRVENIQELRNSIAELENETEEHLSLGEYLEQTSLMSATDSLEEEKDYVKLMTIHNSKGLEFPVVFLTGMEQDIFPGSAKELNEEDLEEERRLCYVAITRAEKELHLSHSLERTVYGQTSYQRKESRFIDEIPKDLIEIKGVKIEKKKEKVSVENFNPFKVGKISDSAFLPGDKVVHKKFGQGLVKDIEEEVRLVIKFREGEKKIPLVVAEKFLSKVD